MPLYLLPNVLGEDLSHKDFFPKSLDKLVPTLDGLIAESPKEGRKYLKRFAYPEGKTFREVPIELLNEHTPDEDLDELIQPIKKGESWGLISDAGLPVLADPGARLVRQLHRLSLPVHTFPGPSSIIYALMLSGLSGQNFAFHGYLPRKPEELRPAIQGLEKRSHSEKETEIVIEAPYRSDKLFDTLIRTLRPNTELSISWNLTLPDQGVQTKTVKEWKQGKAPNLHKTPAVFVFAAK